jgi:hypothetical protein
LNNALDFLVKVRVVPFVTAIEQLSGITLYLPPIPKSKPSEKKDFVLPTANHDNRRAIAYLNSEALRVNSQTAL